MLCRFYCAGAADNRTRLDFHGERRIWDGRLIKQKIKGNSALYIYTDEVLSDKGIIMNLITVKHIMIEPYSSVTVCSVKLFHLHCSNSPSEA